MSPSNFYQVLKSFFPVFSRETMSLKRTAPPRLMGKVTMVTIPHLSPLTPHLPLQCVQALWKRRTPFHTLWPEWSISLFSANLFVHGWIMTTLPNEGILCQTLSYKWPHRRHWDTQRFSLSGSPTPKKTVPVFNLLKHKREHSLSNSGLGSSKVRTS